jgi:hypothetical protein
MLLILLLLSSLLVLSLSLSSNIQCNRNIIKYNSNIIKKHDHQHYTRLNIRLNMLEENDNGFTTKQVLKEETEAPFRSLRKFIYFGLLGIIIITSLLPISCHFIILSPITNIMSFHYLITYLLPISCHFIILSSLHSWCWTWHYYYYDKVASS